MAVGLVNDVKSKGTFQTLSGFNLFSETEDRCVKLLFHEIILYIEISFFPGSSLITLLTMSLFLGAAG